MNGVINLSIIDGWWEEAFDGTNGWAINPESSEEADDADAEALYELLENSVRTLYYTRDDQGISTDWVALMKHSIQSITSRYNSWRMTREYVDRLYIPD